MTKEQKEKLKAIIDADFNVKINGTFITVSSIRYDSTIEQYEGQCYSIDQIEIPTKIKKIKSFGDCLKWFADNCDFMHGKFIYENIEIKVGYIKAVATTNEIPDWFPEELYEEGWE